MTREINEQNMVCERLRARFEYRGVNNPAVQSKVSLRKEKETYDKWVREQKKKRAKEAANSRVAPGFTSAKQRLAGGDYRRHFSESFDAERHEFIPDGGRFGLAFEKGARIRARAAAFDPVMYERRHPAVAAKKNVPVKRTKKERSFASVVGEKIKASLPKKSDITPDEGERVVKRSPIPRGVVAGILLCTVLVMVVIYTFSTYTQVVSDGKELEAERVELMAEKSRLTNLLEVRDDVREIEDYATNTIGMVKSDLVETRHVSIAGGERIEVIRADEQQESGGFFSNILSAMGSGIEGLFD